MNVLTDSRISPMIPLLLGAGYRTVAPDLVGFGRSDKPADRSDYTCNHHVEWMQAWLEQADLNRITLVCQDWGGLIGLRLLTAHPERFARAVVANTGLPTGDFPISEAFLQWRKFSVEVPEFNVGAIINSRGTAAHSRPRRRPLPPGRPGRGVCPVG